MNEHKFANVPVLQSSKGALAINWSRDRLSCRRPLPTKNEWTFHVAREKRFGL